MMKFFKKESIDKDKRLSVHELDKLGGLTPNQIKDIKGRVPILVVDDEQHEMFKKKLYENGYHGVSALRESPSDDEVRKYSVLIVDVAGIRDDIQSNGLIFAKRIKKMYPLKEVIVMSGQPKYIKQLTASQGESDIWFFKKGTALDSLFDRIDTGIRNLYDPSLVWRAIRYELLRRDGSTKMDTDINLVAKWEDEFVQDILKVDSPTTSINIDWFKLIKGGVSLATEVKALLDCIAPLVSNS